MAYIIGHSLIGAALAFFALSFPRGGKLARFTGTPWESLIVLTAVGALACGITLAMFGAPNFLKG